MPTTKVPRSAGIEWYKFLNPPAAAPSQSMQIALGPERFPFQYRNKKFQFGQVELFLLLKDGQSLGSPLALQLGPPTNPNLSNVTLVSSASFLGGVAYGSIKQLGQPVPPSQGSPPSWTLQVDKASKLPDGIDDILMLCRYSVS